LDSFIRRAGQCRWSRVLHSYDLATGVGIATAILRHPNPRDDLRASPGIRKGPEDRDTLQAAVVLGHRRVKGPRGAAFHSAVSWAEREYGWRGVHDRNRLAAAIRVAAAIPGEPCPRDELRAEAVGNCLKDRHALEATIIDGSWRAEFPSHTALDRPVAGTECEHGRNRVLICNGLAAEICVAAAIFGHPNTCDDLRADAGIGEGAVYKYTSKAAIVLRYRIIELPRRAAFDCLVGRAEREHRRSRILHRHCLAAIGSEPAAIYDLPYASNVHRARAISRRAENCERNVGSAAIIRRARIVECPCRAAFDCLVGRANDRSRWTRRVCRRRHLESQAYRNALRVDHRIPRRREWRVAPNGDVIVRVRRSMPPE